MLYVRLLLPATQTSPRGLYATSAIDALFDRIDEDRSGFLDLREAKHALKDLQQRAAKMRSVRTAQRVEL